VGRVMGPEMFLLAEADATATAQGTRGRPECWLGSFSSAGVVQRGTRSSGSPGNLGDPVVSTRDEYPETWGAG